jgi:hypothetical protein
MQVRYLFHGTSEQAVESIIHSDTAGFQPLLSVKNYYVCATCFVVALAMCAKQGGREGGFIRFRELYDPGLACFQKDSP